MTNARARLPGRARLRAPRTTLLFAQQRQPAQNLVKSSTLEQLMQRGTQQVDAGMIKASQCGQALDAIVDRIRELDEMVHEIAKASAEQARGVEEITAAINQMDTMTQHNASGAQATADSARSLNDGARGLTALVGELTAVVQGARAA